MRASVCFRCTSICCWSISISFAISAILYYILPTTPLNPVVFSYTLDQEIGLTCSTGTANLNDEISLVERSQKNTTYLYTGKHTRIYVKHEQQNNTQRQGLIVSGEVWSGAGIARHTPLATIVHASIHCRNMDVLTCTDTVWNSKPIDSIDSPQ